MNKTKSKAHVVDGKLILSLPGAVTPVLWQMDLNDAKASALEIQKGATEDQHKLTLKTPRGETMDVATFDNKDTALNALIMISKALEKAQGQIRTQTQAGNAQETVHHQLPKKGNGLVTALLGISFVVILVVLWSMMAASPNSQALTTSTNTTATAEQSVGVPVSADAYLRGQ